MSKIETRQEPIESKLGKYLTPKYGKGVFFAGGKGRGKTHEVVNYIWHLVHDLGWHVFTNIQFRYTGPGEPPAEMPENVHFIKYMSGLWKEFADLREEHGDVPVVVIIDEFHTTVNRLESHKYYNIVTGLMNWLSQIRKFTQSALFCSQYLIQIPKDPRMYADHFIVKNQKVAKQLTIDGQSLGVRYFSQVLTLEDGEVKILDQHDNIKWKSAKKFRKRHISKDLADLIKHNIVDDILASASCPWNDPDRGDWQYLSDKVSSFKFDPINNDECAWFDSLIEELGETERKGITIYEGIRQFFEDYEEDEDEGMQLTEFEKLSDSRKALVIYEVSQLSDRRSLSKVDAAAIFGVSPDAVRKAEDRWDDYMIDEHVDRFIEGVGDGSEIQTQNPDGRTPPTPA